MAIDMTSAEARLHHYADTVGTEPPARLVAEDGSPSPELLAFCKRYGASLDWIILGDVRALIHRSQRLARLEQ